MANLKTPQVQTQILQSNASFANRLYEILAKKPGNVFFSPLSVHAVFCMAHQGAKGETAKVIEKVLQIPEASITGLGYETVTKGLKGLEKVLVYLAFRIYLRQEAELDETFVENVQKHFFSQVECLNFDEKDQVVDIINEWVEKQTAEKIKNIVDEDFITKDTVMFLVNAIYFKGAWHKKFSPARTCIQKFYIDEGNTVVVEMMHKMEDALYKYDEEFQAQILVLPFINRNVKMIFILPKERNGIAFLETNLGSNGLTRFLENLSYVSVKLSLPKFKMEISMDLVDVLKEVGLENIFSLEANFSGMLKSKSDNICVGKVVQKAYIDVNEEGVEAAAATVMQKIKKSGRWVEETVSFVVDHPVMFLLAVDVEDTTNILFCGRLSDPKY